MRAATLIAVLLTAVTVQAGIISDSGVKGGLAVVVGCDDTELISGFGKNDSFLVQLLDTDPAKVEKARQAIGKSGSYGRVTAHVFNGKGLPYADGLVNLLVDQSGRGQVSRGEIERVLAPRGVSILKGKKTVKPVPEDIDEWTHYLYDAKNNAVSRDRKVASPKSLQWVSGPRWSRHHDHMSSVSAVVSAGGRVFSIMDEGPPASIQYPSDWKLTARDAFSGTLLWKKPISHWHTGIWPAKAGPAQLPRRLVAVGERVFVTLGMHAPVSMLDAATGNVIKTFKDTEHTEEIVVSGNQLFVMAHAKEPPKGEWKLESVRCWTESRRSNSARPWAWSSDDPRKIVALDIESGKVLWSKDTPVAKITLGVEEKRVVFHDGANAVCLDRNTGKELWKSERADKGAPGAAVKAAPNLVIFKEVVLYSAGPGTVTAMSIENGKTLWTDFHGPTGHQSTFDLLVADGLVWSTSARRPRRPKKGNNSKKAPEAKPSPPWTYFGRDPVSGEVKKVFPPGKSDWFHHRCHRGRGTDRYLIMARTGIEYVDLKTGNWQPNPWVRGACLYGYMPANGLTYAPPHPCGCYIESKLTGFNAMLSERPLRKSNPERLFKGPAYGAIKGSRAKSEDWPTYRGDTMRSGSTTVPVSSKLDMSWVAEIGGKISPATIANGKVYVAAVDLHTVYSIDSKNGEILWKYTAGGRVDTPPTIHGDLAVFGCRDGHVYCLRASDGELVWRFRAVDEERLIVSYEQLESTWPVNGAVLIKDGSLYCVAGRSMFLDGGLHLLKLDVMTGNKQLEEIMGDTIPGTDTPFDTTAGGLDMPVALPDILSSDGKRLYMRSQTIGFDGKRANVEATRAKDQGGEEAHLFCGSGFLDDTWFHRAYWVFGRGYGTGHNGWFRAGRFAPAGRMLVFNKEDVFGYGRLPNLYVWSSANEYQLYSAKREITQDAIERVSAANRKQEGRGDGGHGHEITFDRKLYGSYKLAEISALDFNWRQEEPPLQARAMVLADKTLFVAGPEDVVDEEDIFSNPFDERVKAKAAKQVAGLKGQKGGLLHALSTEDGKKLKELRLESCPVFDGMASSNGKLFISMMNGNLVCFE